MVAMQVMERMEERYWKTYMYAICPASFWNPNWFNETMITCAEGEAETMMITNWKSLSLFEIAP
jgi:hypothetical protein